MNRRTVIAGAGAVIAGGLSPLARPGCAPPVVSFEPTLFELRSYLAQPGRREELIGMFEDVFLDAYQAGGARIVGTFRSLDEADRWVWIRAFADAAGRGPALRNFYGGAVWKANADACNATIAGIEEALLLREVRVSGLPVLCAGAKGSARAESVVVVEVFPLERAADEGFATSYEDSALPLVRQFGAEPVAAFISDHAENSFPGQAVRGGSVFVAVSRFASVAAHAAFDAARLASVDWQSRVWPRLTQRLTGRVEKMRLGPCGRSGIR